MWLEDVTQLRSTRGATSMLSHLCCSLYTRLAENAAEAEVWGIHVNCAGGYQVCSGDVTEPQSLEAQMAWVFPDWHGLSDHMKLSRTGHCVQQDAASSCRDSCILNGVGDLSFLPHLRSFFFIALVDFLLLLSMP